MIGQSRSEPEHIRPQALTNAAGWDVFVASAPDLARAVRSRLTVTKHHVVCTLRADGSPRVSGTEVQFHDGNLWMGSMGGARKADDLRRDPRFALHANPGDGSMDGGDAKMSGYAVELVDSGVINRWLEGRELPPGPFHLFRLDLEQVTLTCVHPDGDRLRIETWHPGRLISVVERR